MGCAMSRPSFVFLEDLKNLIYPWGELPHQI
nr:MAG TPA: hypothetical protein [Caudoviricetes sp.]